MQCTVYRLRHQGAKLSSEEIKATTLTGTLRLTKHGPMGQPVKEATLQHPTGRDVLPPLRGAEVVTVDRGGLMVRGHVSHFEGQRERFTLQVWWCVPVESSKG